MLNIQDTGTKVGMPILKLLDHDTNIGMPVLNIQDAGTKVRIPILKLLDDDSNIGMPVLNVQDAGTKVGIPILKFQDHDTNFGMPVLKLQGHIRNITKHVRINPDLPEWGRAIEAIETVTPDYPVMCLSHRRNVLN